MGMLNLAIVLRLIAGLVLSAVVLVPARYELHEVWYNPDAQDIKMLLSIPVVAIALIWGIWRSVLSGVFPQKSLDVTVVEDSEAWPPAPKP